MKSAHNRRAAVGVALLLALAVLSGQLAGASSAAAGSPCQHRWNVSHSDGFNGTFNDHWTEDEVCSNAYGAQLYLGTDQRADFRSGKLLSTRSWFVCWTRGDYHRGGNNVWYYTQGDWEDPDWPGQNAWGFIPAYNIYNVRDPEPGLDHCPNA